MTLICHEIEEWIEEEVLDPVVRERERQEQRCSWCCNCSWRRPWCCACSVACWFVTVIFYVIEWVIIIVERLVTRVVCEAIVAVVEAVRFVTANPFGRIVLVIGFAFLIIFIFVLVYNWFTNEGMPVHGNWCGLDNGGTFTVDPESGEAIPNEPVPKVVDAVDQLCFEHDACIVATGNWCDCNWELIQDLPAAIASEAERGNVAAVTAGDAILVFFSTVTPVQCMLGK